MKKALYGLLALVLLAGLFGCTPYGSIYGLAMDNRSMSRITKDTAIWSKIKTRLVEENSLKGLKISVYVYCGQVYLVGQKDTEAQAQKMVGLAKGVAGVKSVTTYLLLRQEKDPCGFKDSVKIQAQLKKDLVGDLEIDSTNIDVDMVHCDIVLLGLPDSQAKIDKAVAYAKAVPGVAKVHSYLKIYDPLECRDE